jgi:hypothetical protein
MDAIEIFFAAYGALLALAVARLLSSAARLIRARETVKIGWATPLLMLLLLLEICSFLTNASKIMGLADLGLGVVTNGIVAAGCYFLIASLVAPDDLTAWPDLDAYYDKHKSLVVGGMIVGSLLGFEVTSLLVRGFAESVQVRWMGLRATLLLAFYSLIVVLFLIRNRAANLVLLAMLNAIFVVVMFTF